jgi:hypothetical protein
MVMMRIMMMMQLRKIWAFPLPQKVFHKKKKRLIFGQIKATRNMVPGANISFVFHRSFWHFLPFK